MSFTRFVIYCLLPAAFNINVVAAQTHPKKKRGYKKVVMQKQLSTLPPEPNVHFNPYWEKPSFEVVPDSNGIYTYVEQMPTTLNGQDIILIINQLMVLPPNAPSGRVFVQFEVNRQGYIKHPEITKGLRADLDSAVVAAARKLPRVTPGKISGQAVRVSVMVAITIPERKQP